jgi:hypothetical protein
VETADTIVYHQLVRLVGGQWLVLICCERKILLAGRWLVADADLMLEKSTAGWLADQPAEQAQSTLFTVFY